MTTSAMGPVRNHVPDAVLALLVVLIVSMMIVPLPTWLLDLLIAGNLGLCVLLLVTALHVPHGLAFTTMPTVLLVTTLYRLALNVSSTRLILLQADAGRIIQSFGEFVVRGNYVVGFVIFLILTIIQYLVVAKGGERVAEVGARFTLDAMPGKQLAIDADLRSGALPIEAARAKRADLERESQFYGAMDGAMKFVKGDAIAGIVIAVISLLGGTGIGVGMRDMTFADSVRLYGLLTIGDGLVSQIPSLVISIAAGLVVTRVASRDGQRSLGSDIASQLFTEPRVLVATAGFLGLVGLLPGMPLVPFFVLAAGSGSAAFVLWSERKTHAARALSDGGRPAVVLELAPDLAASLQAQEPTSVLRAQLDALSARVQRELSLPAPFVHVALAPELDEGRYVLRVREAPLAFGKLGGSEATRLATLRGEIEAVLIRSARELLGFEDVKRLLDSVALHSPALVHGVTPKPVSLPVLTEVLRGLLDEGVGLRALPRILETLAEHGPRESSAHALREHVRRALREQIVERYIRGGVLRVQRLDPLIEDTVRDAIVAAGDERRLALAPTLARDIAKAVARSQRADGVPQVLVTAPEIRRFVREIVAADAPDAAVLSFTELPPALVIEEDEPVTP